MKRDVRDSLTEIFLALAKQGELEREQGLYQKYAEMFVDKLAEFAHTETLQISRAEEFLELPLYGTSICLSGDVHFVGGLLASEPVFVELAGRYGEEELSSLDDMAQDCMAEFVNTLNGVFAVSLGEDGLECELDLPRFAQLTENGPHGSYQLALKLITEVGIVYLVMSADEFF